MFAGKPRVFDAFSAHEDEVTQLPLGAALLAGNAWSAVHAADIPMGPPGGGGAAFWGVQYHPEYDLHELARLTYCRVKKFVGMGLFRSEAAAHLYVEQLEALHADPQRKDLAWALGVDGDVLDAAVREAEVGNWLRHQVLPYARRRACA
jgi:GMP synthase (glutamine-hydrolysing)